MKKWKNEKKNEILKPYKFANLELQKLQNSKNSKKMHKMHKI